MSNSDNNQVYKCDNNYKCDSYNYSFFIFDIIVKLIIFFYQLVFRPILRFEKT